MKHLLFICLLCSTIQSYAQFFLFRYIPSGRPSQNFTLYAPIPTDVEPDSLTDTYHFLDEGKTVLFFYFHAGEAVSWAYHTSGALQQLKQNLGEQVVIIYAPIDVTPELLNGTDPTSQGNWLESLPDTMFFPSIRLDLHDPLRPLLLKICPDRILQELPLVAYDSLLTYMDCELTVSEHDAKVVFVDMDTTGGCVGEARTAQVVLCNMGSEPLTATDIVLTQGSEVLQTIVWEGNLLPYQTDTVTLSGIAFDGAATTLQFYTQNPNGQPDQRPENDSLSITFSAPTYWDDDKMYIEVLTDGFGHQVYWEIKDQQGDRLGFGGNDYVGTVNEWLPATPGAHYEDHTFYYDTIDLSTHPNSCLTLRLVSGMGYGLCCGFGEDGYFRIKKGNTVIQEWTSWGWKVFQNFYTSFPIPLQLSASATDATDSNTNGTITLTASGGQAPYQYSINCGETYVSTNEFAGLEAGVYCVAVMDSIGQVVTDTVEVLHITGIEEAIYGRAVLSVKPNPAQDILQIQLLGVPATATETEANLFDMTGRRVTAYRLQRQGSSFVASVSISELPAGVYMLRSPYAASVKVQKWF